MHKVTCAYCGATWEDDFPDQPNSIIWCGDCSRARWELEDGIIYVHDESGELAVTIHSQKRGGSEKEREKAMLLAAAAPELLAALEDAEAKLTAICRAIYVAGKASAVKEASSGWKEAAEPARAAIAKAKGA